MTQKPLDLTAIKARAAKAALGPWHRLSATTRGGFTWGENQINDLDGSPVVGWNGFDDSDSGTKEQRRRNARFIAHARRDVPALVTEVERLRVLADDLADALADFNHDWAYKWRGSMYRRAHEAMIAYYEGKGFDWRTWCTTNGIPVCACHARALLGKE